MTDHPPQTPPFAPGAAQPTEEELRAAYEAELSRISSSEVVLQTVVSLLNLGARRLGLGGAPDSERDPEQVRDAIDAVRGLMPVLERRLAGELGPLRDALAQLQMAFAREVQAGGADRPGSPDAAQAAQPGQSEPEPPESESDGPGPAQASGRLWVPGR